MSRKLLCFILCLTGLTSLMGCQDEDLEKVYDDGSLDDPFMFSVDYNDSILIPYSLSAPISQWMSLLKDETKVCKLSIPGTHDTMTGMGFYQPVMKYLFNLTAISQVSTLEEQMDCGIRFFDIRPVVSIDTLATSPAEKQILRLSHGISEIDVTFEEAIDQLQSFLQKHPSEFFIVKIQADNGMENQNNWTVLLNKALSLPKYQNLFQRNWRPDITVGEMRGKILWLSRFDLRPLNPLYHYPVVYCDWPDEDPDIDEELHPEAQRSCAMYNMDDPQLKATLYKQDYYKTTTAQRMKNKQQTVIEMMHSAREATAGDEDIWIVNHCSAYTEVSPRGYITNAANLHPLVMKDLQDYEGTVGIMPMDMACHDYIHCIINGGTPYTSDYLYGFHALSQSITHLLIASNKPHFK